MGLSQGLWAFAQHPIHVSQELVSAVQACSQYLKESTSEEIFQQLAPEAADLVSRWDEYSDTQRGEIAGALIGTYGVEIFGCMGALKGVKYFNELKTANRALTLETMASNPVNKAIITQKAVESAERRAFVRSKKKLEIRMDSQNKHIVGTNSYNVLKKKNKNPSILEHPDPQALVYKYAGTGIKEGPAIPGTAGYKEVVNCGEFVGYDVHPQTGVKTATTWVKIHYAKDSVHIVPTLPRRVL